MERILALPLMEALVLLFVIVMLRANATYWVGRGVAAGVIRSGLLSRHRRTGQRAEALISRWGVLAVPLSFLTVGLQTAVNGSAGALRMPLRRYLPAVVVGSVIWAVLYATAGLAAFSAAFALAAESPWLLAAVAVLVVGVLAVLWMRRRRRTEGRTTSVRDGHRVARGDERAAAADHAGATVVPTGSVAVREESSHR